MSDTNFLIGVDESVELVLGTSGAPANANVYVEVCGKQVSITGPFEGWEGYAVLADCDSENEAWDLARRIKANPVLELDKLGYDHANWFRPVV